MRIFRKIAAKMPVPLILFRDGFSGFPALPASVDPLLPSHHSGVVKDVFDVAGIGSDQPAFNQSAALALNGPNVLVDFLGERRPGSSAMILAAAIANYPHENPDRCGAKLLARDNHAGNIFFQDSHFVC
jgi:hypothetical protein